MRCVALVALALAAAPIQAAVGQALAGEWVMEQQLRERWMHGRQFPRFVPFKAYRNWLVVDSLRSGADGRRLHFSLQGPAGVLDTALVVTDKTGRITRVHVGLALFSQRGPPSAADSARWLEWRRFRLGGGIVLPETRVWDLVPTFPQGTPRIGMSWTDTLARVATDGPSFRQSMRGTRRSRITGDTAVDGRRLWIVHDSAHVEYEERYLERERTLDTLTQVSRVATGVIRGVHLYDAEVDLVRRRDDTTRLSGEAVLRYPDGRAFRTPARYEGTRRWDLYDAQQHAARLAQLRDESRREFGGMVMVAANELQRRLTDGDARTRDSIVAAWLQTADPDEAVRLFGLLMRWAGRDTAFTARLERLRVSAGDTAYLHGLLVRRAADRTRPFDTTDVRTMLRFMEDPAASWSFNVNRDYLYENLAYSLTSWPPAAANGDSSLYTACTIAACRMLAEQWQTGREPRTRDVGLVAAHSLDPARWADTVLALAGPRRPLLRRAATLAKGIGATWDAASKATMPDPDSDWRTWLQWMDGRDSAQIAAWAARLAALPNPTRSDTVARVRFEETHRTAIRMYMAQTGRDVIGEMQRSYAAAESDSARLIFGTMLQGLGRLRLLEDEIAGAFISGVPARITVARQALLSRFPESVPPSDPDVAAPFIDRLIAATVDSAPLWRFGAAEGGAAGEGRPMLHAPAKRIFVNGDGLPAAVRAKWSSRVEIISREEWNRRDPREAGVFYTFTPVRVWGRFVRVERVVSERLARAEGQAPAQYASANTYYLMELNGDWVIVDQRGWVT